ncbi:ribonuclease H-like domain-containing protein [Rostrohypoxylon terebratum]|nr:ribonuclease H-like domain-containing protein [Rostrohypoxylon terebratum]
MVYKMKFYVDGGCRNNGYTNAIGAAAACLKNRYGKYRIRTRVLDTDEYYATNQRAELLAMILALEWALERYEELDGYPRLQLTIYSDSRYAVGCLNEWMDRWVANGWMNSRGMPVANRDLIEEAYDLEDKVRDLGSVLYEYIPRSENTVADTACNDALDDIENRRDSREDYSSSDESW